MCLKTEWYQKLKDEGFEDIEYGMEHGLLKGLPKLNTESQNYFITASKMAHDYEFVDEYEEVIWRLHVDGKTVEYIAKLLKVTPSKIQRRLDSLREDLKGYIAQEIEEKGEEF